MSNVDDWIKQRDATDKKLAVDEPGEHWFDNPRCPHCGTEVEDWWDGGGLMHDGDKTEFDCAECGKTYKVRMCVETTFQTEALPATANKEGERG